LNNVPIYNKTSVPNLTVRQMIQSFLDEHPHFKYKPDEIFLPKEKVLAMVQAIKSNDIGTIRNLLGQFPGPFLSPIETHQKKTVLHLACQYGVGDFQAEESTQESETNQLEQVLSKNDFSALKCIVSFIQNLDGPFLKRSLKTMLIEQDEVGFTPVHYSAFFSNRLVKGLELIADLVFQEVPEDQPNTIDILEAISKDLPQTKRIRIPAPQRRGTALAKNDLIKNLLHAVEENSINVIKLMVRLGADIDGPLYNGTKNPLLYASSLGNPETVRALIELGADVNGIAVQSNSLYESVGEGHLDVVRVLIEHGANIHCYCANNHVQGYSPLHDAVWTRNLEMVKLLIKNNANFHAKYQQCIESVFYPFTVICGAAAKDSVELINFFADLEISIDDDYPLYWACTYGAVDAVRCLIERGAKIDFQYANSCNRTILHTAALNKRHKVLELLFEMRSEECKQLLDARDDNLNTALIYTAATNSLQCFQILMGQGASYDLKNAENLSAYDIASHLVIKEMIAARRQQEALTDTKKIEDDPMVVPAPAVEAPITSVLLSEICNLREFFDRRLTEQNQQQAQQISDLLKIVMLQNERIGKLERRMQ
jgi:ankyrin repeat protein